MRSSPPRVRSLLLVAALVVASLPLAALARKAAQGKPSFRAGDPQAFWLWFDDAGWHLRATGGKDQHSFHGLLRATGGFTGVKPTRPQLFRKIDLDPEALRFDFDLGKDGLEGFDWQQADPCVIAELKLDQRPDNGRVHVGLRGEVPEAFPFIACR